MGVRVPPSALHILAGQNPQRLEHDRVLTRSDSHANSHARKKLNFSLQNHDSMAHVSASFNSYTFSQGMSSKPPNNEGLLFLTKVPLGSGEQRQLIPGFSRYLYSLRHSTMTTPQLHTIEDIGKILNVSRSTVYRLIDRGQILVIDIGGYC